MRQLNGEVGKGLAEGKSKWLLELESAEESFRDLKGRKWRTQRKEGTEMGQKRLFGPLRRITKQRTRKVQEESKRVRRREEAGCAR